MKKYCLSILLSAFVFPSYTNAGSIIEGYLVSESCTISTKRNFIYKNELSSNHSIVIDLSTCPLEVKDTLSIAVDLNKNELTKFDLNQHSENVHFSWLSNFKADESQFIFSPELFDFLKYETKGNEYGQIFISALYN